MQQLAAIVGLASFLPKGIRLLQNQRARFLPAFGFAGAGVLLPKVLPGVFGSEATA